ncbi:hypothetical protein MNBD_NITROSPINAE03-811 [hydrothermal vent metagenome]|uniref:HMA domain-containing protein n=1 Tax=hydrothermal vent metagenome TaxID=652676 RepID=A0A3B1BYV9_9ZZZZ
MKKTLSIEGMTCGHCVAHTTEVLGKVDGVSSVNVDFVAKTAIVESETEIADDVLKDAVTSAGYSVVSIS